MKPLVFTPVELRLILYALERSKVAEVDELDVGGTKEQLEVAVARLGLARTLIVDIELYLEDLRELTP